MTSECPPENKTRYNHQEKCKRLKELFLAENPSSQGGILVDKNENIVNRPAGYYFSNQNVQNRFLGKETPLKVKAHITGLPQPQTAQKVSFANNNFSINCSFKQNYFKGLLDRKADNMQNIKSDSSVANPINNNREQCFSNKILDDVRNSNVKDSTNESTFVRAKRALFSKENSNDSSSASGTADSLNHSKCDKRFNVKMLHSFSVCSNQNDKNACVPAFPRSHLYPTLATTYLTQKKDKNHSSNTLVLESDFLIDDEISDQPSLITFEKTDTRTGAKSRKTHKQDERLEKKNHLISKNSFYDRRTQHEDADVPNYKSDSYYYMYNQLVPDVRSIKSSVLHLKRLLSQNILYHQLAEADQRTSEENVENELILEQLADMKRQTVYLEEQLRDRDRIIGNLQREMSGLTMKSEKKDTCSKATQT